jgi:hypothetical protein
MYFNSLTAWEKARLLAIAEEKMRIRESLLPKAAEGDTAIVPSSQPIKQVPATMPIAANDLPAGKDATFPDVGRIRDFSNDEFLKEAQKSAGAIEAKARLLEEDGKGGDYRLQRLHPAAFGRRVRACVSDSHSRGSRRQRQYAG